MNKKKMNIADLIINLVIVISTIIAVAGYFVSGPDILGSAGIDCLKYFTTDSNILCALASAVYFCFNLKKLNEPETVIPKWVDIFKFSGAVSVGVTFFTVVFFLVPVGMINSGAEKFFMFFEGNVFFLHFSTPVLAILSVTCFEKDNRIRFKDTLWSLIPTILYSLIYLIMVVYVKKWTDWYGFTFGGRNVFIPVSMLAMYLLTLGIALIMRKIRNRNLK